MFLTTEPIGVSAEFRDSQIVVQWLPPDSKPEMVENYIVTIEDRKSGNLFNMTVPRDTRQVIIDPLPFENEYLVYIQTENFHGLSRKSASVIVNIGEISNFQKNIAEPSAGSTAGPGAAIGASVSIIAIVALFVGITYHIRRKRRVSKTIGAAVHSASATVSEGTGTSNPSEHQLVDDKLPKPLNAFYIPGYFGRRGISRQKTCSDSSASYATSFSLRRSSNSSEPVYSDVSGAYLWMFGNDKKVPAPPAHPHLHPQGSEKPSLEQNIYDNNVPARQ